MTASKAVFLFPVWLFTIYIECTGSIKEASQLVPRARKGDSTKQSKSYAVLNATYQKDQVVAPLDSKYHAGLGFRIMLQRLDTSSARSHRPL